MNIVQTWNKLALPCQNKNSPRYFLLLQMGTRTANCAIPNFQTNTISQWKSWKWKYITKSSKNYRKTVERSFFSKERLFSAQISTYNLQMSDICAVACEMLNLEINSGFPSYFYNRYQHWQTHSILRTETLVSESSSLVIIKRKPSERLCTTAADHEVLNF